MQIIDQYMPLNSKEVVDKLVSELEAKGWKSPEAYHEIFQKINKAKIQIYFKDTYKESDFTSATLPEDDNQPDRIAVSQEEKNAVLAFVQTQTQQIPLPQETFGDKKYIYGTYAEMAFHNFFLTLSHIYSLVTGKNILQQAQQYRNQIVDFADATHVWEPMFATFRNCNSEDAIKVKELLYKHFPFLVPFLDMSAKKENNPYSGLDEIDILTKLSRFLRIVRHTYSHFLFVPHSNQLAEYEKLEPFVLGGLERCYTGSKREIKSRFCLSDKEMFCAEGYDVKMMAGRKTIVDRPGFHYKLSKKNEYGSKNIRVFGLVYLLSLFLEKKYSKILCDKTNCVQLADEKVICEMLSVYRIRLHIQKLTVTKDTDALALDILNELQRCPKQLFEILPPSEQQKFRIKPKRGEDPTDVLMIRHQDRFATLIMKYIDDANLFQDLRFQVSLGRYFFKFYNKRCIDSTEPDRVRALCKDIHGFGHLRMIEETRVNVWADLIREYDDVHRNTADESPYITDHHAQYMISGNRIGIHLCEDGTHLRMPELMADGTRNESPDCFLSCYELPAMVFLIHLKGGGECVEEIIKMTVAQYRRLFADIEKGELHPVETEEALLTLLESKYNGIHIEGLPTNIRQYLLMQQSDVKKAFQVWAKEYLIQLIEDTKRRKAKIESDKKVVGNPKLNKLGKKSYVVIKPGRLAAFMAKDMMLFQPNGEGNTGKLTGLNFRILQAVLATYNGDVDALKRVLHNAHLLGDAGNPIVSRMFVGYSSSYSNTIDLYCSYLNKRLDYLKECLKEGSYDNLAFLYPNRTCWQEHNEDFYRQLAGRYLTVQQDGQSFNKAIELPRGLFETEIRKELTSIEATQSIASDITKNTSYLIYAYFKQVMQDDCQPFYDAKRSYPLFNCLYKEKPQSSKVYFNTAEIREMLQRKSSRSIRMDMTEYVKRTRESKQETEQKLARMLTSLKNTETDLKRQKVEDMLLFLIAQRILIGSKERGSDAVRFDAFSSIKLREILTDEVLSKPISLSVTVKSQTGFKKTIYQDDIKLKNYSQFYRFLSDRRLPTLLDLTFDRSISRETIEEEFSNYDKVHPHILQEVFNYECDYLCTVQNLSSEGSTDFSSIIQNDPQLMDDSVMMTNIRNSFAHGHYPNGRKVALASSSALPEKAKKVSDVFVEKIKKST